MNKTISLSICVVALTATSSIVQGRNMMGEISINLEYAHGLGMLENSQK